MAIGYFGHGVLGATLVGLAFVLPSFLMVLVLSALYVAFGGLWWMQAVFYGVSAAVIGIIAIASYKLAWKVNGRDPLLWGIFGVLFIVTAVAQAELAEFFLVAGLLVLLVKAPPTRAARAPSGLCRRARRARPLDLRRGRDRREQQRAVADPALLHQGRGVCLRQWSGDRPGPL
jgi:chromate transport protein ChrA